MAWKILTCSYLCLLILPWIFSAGCQHCDCYGNTGTQKNTALREPAPPAITEISTRHISRFIQQHKASIAHGLQLLEKEKEAYLACITEDKAIKLLSIKDSSIIYTIKLDGYAAIEQFSSFSLSGDTICILSPKATTLTMLGLTNDHSVKKLGSFKLNIGNIPGEAYVMFNPGAPAFALSYPHVFIRYGLRKGKNYIDTTAYLSYDLASNTYKKIIRYPSCFSDCAFYDYNSNIDVSNGSVYCLFKWHDAIYKYDASGTLAAEGLIAHECRFEPFDKSNEKNLAYVRKYLETSENNNKLLANGQGYVFVSKQLEKEDLKSPEVNEFFVFNAQLQQVRSFKSPVPVYPYAFFKYSAGFMYFNDSLTKAFYYEMEKP
jgi:hypothetical protein